jgi:ubiquinone/menaquinone biosynthesis C-methylase UbiE
MSYVIRGGEEGKARLQVIADALWPTTAALLDGAGIGPGKECLDLGCGGGDVTLAMARLVQPAGRVLGIDMDRVKVDLAGADAAEQNLPNVEFRVGDAATLDAGAEFDLVYARLLLTHVQQPDAVLGRMVAAVKPGGAVVVEDLDHSAVFSYPACPPLDHYVGLYNEMARRRGGDPTIGPKLPGMYRRAGLVDLRVGAVQPVFMDGDAKYIHQITLENVREPIISAGLTTSEDLDSLRAGMDTFAADADTMISFPRIFQVSGRRREPLADTGGRRQRSHLRP